MTKFFNNTKIEDNSTKVLSKEVTKVDFCFTYRPNAHEYTNIHRHIAGMGLSNALSVVNNAKLAKVFSEEVDDYKLELTEIMKSANNENKANEELKKQITELENNNNL
ncbi:259_t:CDS:1 [Ambispora gerdemannii]|uniref:259_t:CDS:1 n=1 Tax=Ambispora gerdemannii TaxID=144530 RepID=A0A9N9CH90_9GLOM|nr:259_t:CDS:1 [Ambispora gerdemannii]